jgi:hypothetical protein
MAFYGVVDGVSGGLSYLTSFGMATEYAPAPAPHVITFDFEKHRQLLDTTAGTATDTTVTGTMANLEITDTCVEAAAAAPIRAGGGASNGSVLALVAVTAKLK